LDDRVRKAMFEKMEEAVTNVDEISEIVQQLGNISVESRNDFALGIAIGRVYNSFHYQTRRALKRNATKEEFAEFLHILAERAGEIRKALKQQ
jgi:alkylhydroperoxidase/carboxymuconolactone decarboxylase family protein YurZ